MKKEKKADPKKDKKVKAKKTKASVENSEKDTDNEDILKIQQEKNEFQEKFIRLYSEYENYRKRTAKEKIDIINNASKNVMADLLQVLDDFERAIENNKDSNDSKAIKEGVNLIYNKFLKTLQVKGLKPMESKNTPFDVDLHEAITNIPAPDETLKGKVVDVVEKGYYLNDRVLRFYKVVVGQ
jgi:molecular chaperone GrpE